MIRREDSTRRRRRPQAAALIERARAAGRNLLEPEALRLLQAYGFPVPRFAVLPHPPTVPSETLARLGYPLVAKAVSPQISHKTEAGAVRLGIQTERELTEALGDMEKSIRERVPEARVDGWLVCAHLPAGTELIAGGIVDPQFGPTVMVGIGGILAEVYRDVAFRLAPLSPDDAEEMIGGLKGQALLDGARGLPRVPRRELADLLVRLGTLMQENPEITECDLNPIICHGGTLTVADARLQLGRVQLQAGPR